MAWGPMIHWVYLCGWSLPSTWLVPETWLYDTINILQFIQNNRGIRNTKNDAPKDFRKRSRKIKSDIVSRILSQKIDASNKSILYYHILSLKHQKTPIREKQQLKEVSIAPAISAKRLLKFSHCTCRVHIGQDRETWLFVISHRERSWWGELLEWASNIS